MSENRPASVGPWSVAGGLLALGRPDLPPLDPPLLKWLVIGRAPQIGLWVPFTVVGGSFFGGLAALVSRRAFRRVSHAAA